MNHTIKLIEDVIPTREGTHGKAWRLNLTEMRNKAGVLSSDDATICMWLVEAKWAHPYWSNYLIACIHLRPISGRPAIIRLEGATHEVWVFAMDPKHVPDFDRPPRTHLLPPNFVGQWIEAGDIQVDLKIEQCVEEIIAGQLNPDTDGRRQWIKRFSNSNCMC